MNRLVRILLIALALAVTLAPISCKKPVAPPDAAKLSSNDYGTRMRAIVQLIRSDANTSGKPSDNTYVVVEKAVADFEKLKERNSYKWLLLIKNYKRNHPENVHEPNKVLWDAMANVGDKHLNEEGVSK